MRPEILSPAGDFEKLKSAVYFGADAVYLAGSHFGMRAASGNFVHQLDCFHGDDPLSWLVVGYVVWVFRAFLGWKRCLVGTRVLRNRHLAVSAI